MASTLIEGSYTPYSIRTQTKLCYRYWDPSILPEKYSFVDWAIAQGYSVFFYDRLGVGKSSVYVTRSISMPIRANLITTGFRAT
jgi:hypothetical protein